MKILIAGLGAVGQRHARNLRLLRRDVELHALRHRGDRAVINERLERDTSRDVHAELGIRPHASVDDAFAARPDVVFVCTPSAMHLALAQRAADAGCHLFIEKPLSHSMDGVRQLAEMCRARRLVAMLGCQWRFNPLVRALRGALEEKLLGSIREVEMRYSEWLPSWHPYEDYRTSYAARRDLGGGVVLTQIHDYDLAFHLFGFPGSVSATGGHLSELEIDVEDTADATLALPGFEVRVRQSFAERPSQRSVTVRGSSGTAYLDLVGARLDYSPVLAPAESLRDYERNRMFSEEVEHFLECVESGATPKIPLADGIDVLNIALAVKDSIAHDGRAVQLNRGVS